jgi:hypothetical protein
LRQGLHRDTGIGFDIGFLKGPSYLREVMASTDVGKIVRVPVSHEIPEAEIVAWRKTKAEREENLEVKTCRQNG